MRGLKSGEEGDGERDKPRSMRGEVDEDCVCGVYVGGDRKSAESSLSFLAVSCVSLWGTGVEEPRWGRRWGGREGREGDSISVASIAAVSFVSPVASFDAFTSSDGTTDLRIAFAKREPPPAAKLF